MKRLRLGPAAWPGSEGGALRNPQMLADEIRSSIEQVLAKKGLKGHDKDEPGVYPGRRRRMSTEDDKAKKGMNLGEIDNDARLKTDVNEFEVGEPMASDVNAIYDIPVQISAVLGKSTMQVSQLLKLGRGAVVELDRKVGEAIDIYVNNRLVARGEVVVVEDKLGVTMTEIVKSDRT
jgi:flagellar motor switch protein FliN/FliY